MWWGVAAALLANVLYSTGFVLEKRALAALPSVTVRQPAHLLRLVLGSPLWIAGSLALASGFGAQLAVYRTLPIAAAQGLFVSGLVLLLLLSSSLLGERTTGRERYAIGAILGALLMVVLSLREGTDTVSRQAPVPLILLVCVPTLAAGLLLYGSAERRSRRRHRMPTTGVEYGVAVGLLYGVSSLAIKGVSSRLPDFLDRPGAAVLGLLASPYPYLLLCTGVFGLVMSQAALQRCRASLVVPVCTTVTCLFTAVLGTFAFGEALPQDPVRLALRVGGTVLAMSVLLAMPKHDAPGTPPDDGPAAAPPDTAAAPAGGATTGTSDGETRGHTATGSGGSGEPCPPNPRELPSRPPFRPPFPGARTVRGARRVPGTSASRTLHATRTPPEPDPARPERQGPERQGADVP